MKKNYLICSFLCCAAPLLLICLLLTPKSSMAQSCGATKIITTVAGIASYSALLGDGGPATDAQLSANWSIVIDSAGNLYVSTDARIRKISTSGIITTIAGTGTGGFSGDGGAATAAEITTQYLAIDGVGNLYLTDQSSRVRKITPSGIITTIAGNGILAYSGDGGPATSASIPMVAIAADSKGNVFVSDLSGRIRKIDTAGFINTIAGTGTTGYSGDGGPATSANISATMSLAVDNKGNLFFENGGHLRKIDTLGIVHTIAGAGTNDYHVDGVPATSAKLNTISGIMVDESGNVFISEGYIGDIVRKIDTSGIISTTLAAILYCIQTR